MANTLKFGNGQWYGKKDTILAYNDENKNYKPLPFSFDRASSATVVNKEGLIETVGSGEPRIDYKDDSKGALLLEPSRSNSLLQSNQFDTTWAITNATVLGGQSGIYGSSDAWKLSENTVNSVHILLQNTISISNYTFSIYLKKGTKNKVMLFDGTNNEGVKFNLETQSVHSYYNNPINYKIEILSDGWARYSINTSNASSSFRVYMLDDNYNIAYEGNIENYIYIQYAQAEQGSYATSYIPTQGSIGTRVADSCSDAGNDQVINSTEGTIYGEQKSLETNFSYNYFSAVSDGTNNNRLEIRQSSAGLQFLWRVGGTYQNNIFLENTPFTSTIKYALRYSSTDIKFYVNGSLVGTINSPTLYSAETLNNIQFANGSGGDNFRGTVKDLKYYNTALTDQELIALTTL